MSVPTEGKQQYCIDIFARYGIKAVITLWVVTAFVLKDMSYGKIMEAITDFMRKGT